MYKFHHFARIYVHGVVYFDEIVNNRYHMFFLHENIPLYTPNNLFQLDCGSPEKICLISRDEQSVLVVSYHDLKACFDGAFNELSTLSS